MYNGNQLGNSVQKHIYHENKLFNELFEALIGPSGEYDDVDLDRDLKAQERATDITGNFTFWGIE